MLSYDLCSKYKLNRPVMDINYNRYIEQSIIDNSRSNYQYVILIKNRSYHLFVTVFFILFMYLDFGFVWQITKLSTNFSTRFSEDEKVFVDRVLESGPWRTLPAIMIIHAL